MGSATIAGIRSGRILNSHGDWTVEMTVQLVDGRFGRAAAPRGETPSIFEETDRAGLADPASRDGRAVDAAIAEDVSRALVGRTLDQAGLDEILEAHRTAWGSAIVFALSVAFHQATRRPASPMPGARIAGARANGVPPSGDERSGRSPRLLFNLLNGGLHAYTNPVISDLTEILVLPRHDDLPRALDGYRQLLAKARSLLDAKPIRRIGANRVHDLGEPANDAALALAREILDRTELADAFDLAVDASAGDWLDGDGYRLPVTGVRMERDQLVDWWLGLIERHDLRWVEDPFAEVDREGWRRLHGARPEGCRILGDNLTSTLPAELLAKADLVDGVLLKPDQNGTVSGSRAFAALAREHGLALITSHRSIETETPFLVHLSTEVGADAIKIGPFSDFSSVLRTNELLRLAAFDAGQPDEPAIVGDAVGPALPEALVG